MHLTQNNRKFGCLLIVLIQKEFEYYMSMKCVHCDLYRLSRDSKRITNIIFIILIKYFFSFSMDGKVIFYFIYPIRFFFIIFFLFTSLKRMFLFTSNYSYNIDCFYFLFLIICITKKKKRNSMNFFFHMIFT